MQEPPAVEKQRFLHPTTDEAARAQISLYHERGGFVNTESEVLTMTTDRLCTLSSLTEKARALTNAAAELMDADALVKPSYMDSGSYDQKAKAWDILRTHDTCGFLLFTLLDILERMDAEINAAELDEMNAQKPDGIPDTETAAPKKRTTAPKS